jgi:hypothetical protein
MSTLKVSTLTTPDGSYSIDIANIGGGSGGTPGGSNTQVQFNDSDAFGGDSDFTYNKTNNTLTVANLAVTGTLSGTALGTLNANTANSALSATIAGSLLSNISRVNIYGGLPGQYLRTKDSIIGAGLGQLEWATINTDRITSGNSNVVVDGANATVNGGLNVTGDTVVTGNLTVNGTTTTVNSTTVSTNDKNIVLANNATTAAQADGGGITINGAAATMLYSSAANRINFSHLLGANINGSASSATTAATVTANAQPNITSVGTLSGLTVGGVTSLGPVGNLSITGGTSGQVLSTNGSGGLSWAINGSVTDVTFPSTTGVTFSNKQTSGGVISYSVTNNGILSMTAGNGIAISSGQNPSVSANLVAGTGITVTQPGTLGGGVTLAANVNNILAGTGVQVSNASGAYTVKANVSGIVAGNGVSVTSNAAGVFTVVGNVASVVAGNGVSVTSNAGGAYTVTAAVAGISAGNGVSVTSNAAGVFTVVGNVAGIVGTGGTTVTSNAAGVFTINSSVPVTTVNAGNNITVTGTTTPTVSLDRITYLKEKVSLLSPASSGTVDLDIINGSVVYNTAEAIGNITINMRGNSTTTMNSLLANVGDSITASFIMTNGPSFAACANVFQIDGTTVTVKWAGNQSPQPSASSVLSMSLTTIKTSATPTYTVLGSFAGYF